MYCFVVVAWRAVIMSMFGGTRICLVKSAWAGFGWVGHDTFGPTN